MTYTLRPFEERDAPVLAQITLAAITAVGAARYSPEQVSAWASRHPGPERLLSRWKSGAHITVATDAANTPVAYSLLEDGPGENVHLDMLYCHPQHTRRGLPDALLAQAEESARSGGKDRIYTEASELARPAFERAGYIVQHRRDFEIEGVPIHNYAMEKRLD